MLHQVGVLFALYYDARKHKSKIPQKQCGTFLAVGAPGVRHVLHIQQGQDMRLQEPQQM